MSIPFLWDVTHRNGVFLDILALGFEVTTLPRNLGIQIPSDHKTGILNYTAAKTSTSAIVFLFILFPYFSVSCLCMLCASLLSHIL